MVARQWLGNLKGPKGDTGTLENVTATADAVHSDSPTVDVDVTGDPTNRSLQFNFHGLQGPKGDTGTLEDVTAEVDNTFLEQPTVEVQLSGKPENRSFHLKFTGLRGYSGELENVTATVDNVHSESPNVDVQLSGTPDKRSFQLDFHGIMGPQGERGYKGNVVYWGTSNAADNKNGAMNVTKENYNTYIGTAGYEATLTNIVINEAVLVEDLVIIPFICKDTSVDREGYFLCRVKSYDNAAHSFSCYILCTIDYPVIRVIEEQEIQDMFDETWKGETAYEGKAVSLYRFVDPTQTKLVIDKLKDLIENG